jgi:hypothetical protein
VHGALAVTMEIVNCYLTSLLVRTQVNAAKQPTGKTLFLLKNQGSILAAAVDQRVAGEAMKGSFSTI